MNLLNPPQLDKLSVKRSFNRSANNYDQYAILQHEILNRVIERLDYINHLPKNILDLGCGTGSAVKPLQKRYPKAKLISLDLSYNMLLKTKQHYGLFKKARLLNADIEQLPIKDDSFDMIFSNLALQWVNNLDNTFKEFKRIGRNQGLLMFTTFGPKTLWELDESSIQVDQKPRTHRFIDMHDIGDSLVNARCAEPVIDSEIITLNYSSFIDVLIDLKSIGAVNAHTQRNKGLLTQKKLALIEQKYKEIAFKNNQFQATYEVIYGHAWF